MKNCSKRSLTGIIVAILVIAFCFSPQFRGIYNLPPHLRILEGETTLFTVNFPLTVTVTPITFEQPILIKSASPVYALSKPVLLEPVKLGKANVEFKLFGILPIRTVQIDVMPPLKVHPGGHSIGVVLHSQGVIIVGNSPIKTGKNEYLTPAKDAGVSIGDVILSINGIPVQSDTEVAEIIDECGRKNRPANLLIKRAQEQFQLSVNPILCVDTQRYRIGLFVRDSAAGVGTLTFFEIQTGVYGALGHIITDSDTNQPIDCNQGKIVLATVSGIQQGKRGQPGEKIGVFIEEDNILGNIQKNTQFGIYGKLLSKDIINPIYPNALPVASMSQVVLGPAQIMTVVDGQKIEQFNIEIQKINLQEAPEGKGLVIKVIDKRLIEKTGGIVQGMSGSPIVQNGKIIGAVTHVFVHDPTRGYGCFMDWMLMESGLIPQKAKITARKLFSFSGSNFFGIPDYHVLGKIPAKK